jgi:phage shock protein A
LHVEGGAENLPKWLREEISRVTRKDRLTPTLNLLNAAADAFADGRYRLARDKLREAKELSSRAAAIRELLGLAAYRSEVWEEALRELRTFRRLTGETTHMAVEMDCLRALGRDQDVHKTWHDVHKLGSSPAALKEARVVYGSFLIDHGDPRGAWTVTEPKKLTKEPYEEDLRQWYVAARAATRLGDPSTARRLMEAIEDNDAGFAGLNQLAQEIQEAETN